MPEGYGLLLGFGALVLLVAWLPLALRKAAISLPIICVALGFAGFYFDLFGINLHALHRGNVYEPLTGTVVLVALMGAGLKIDRPLGLRRWITAWRLLAIGMPLMIALTAAAGIWWAGLALPAALLLAAALAPTDPVLAADVQVGPPGEGEEGEVRFGLTAEAGLNDGLAFPVLVLAIALASGVRTDALWFADVFVWRMVLAVAIGWTAGAAMGWLTFRAPHLPLSNAGAGLVALGITIVSYALTEIAGGYGFIAVFLTAIRLRATCPDDPFHAAMADFAGQIERLLVMVILVLFGGEIASGLLDPLTARDIALALFLVLVARPLTAWISMLWLPTPRISRAVTAFFGIRGVGTLYYIAYATEHFDWPEADRLRAITGLVVLGSILLHGLAATPLMRRLDLIRIRAIRRGDYQEAQALTE